MCQIHEKICQCALIRPGKYPTFLELSFTVAIKRVNLVLVFEISKQKMFRREHKTMERVGVMKILILTKNVLVEQQLQNKLQELDHEVFCSCKFIYQLSNSDVYLVSLDMFDVVILSETLPNVQVEATLNLLKRSGKIVFRKTDSVENADNLDFNYSYDGWINVTDSKDIIRETLASVDLMKLDTSERWEILIFTKKLSVRENQLFELLYSARGKCVSHDTIYEKIFNGTKVSASSNAPYLAGLIRKIRKKIVSSEIENLDIITEHGKGYKLVC